jgi:endo-1,4-beta-xylanase
MLKPFRVLHRITMVCLALALPQAPALAAEVVAAKDAPSLHQVFKDQFLVGAALAPSQLKGDQALMLKRHFNSIVAENVMKPEALQPKEGKFEFDAADELVAFAQQNGMKVRGHTLVWHNQTPAWFFEGKGNQPVSKEVLTERLKKHIQTVVGHYKGKVYAWDVVNEAIEPNDGGEGYRKQSKWFEILGPEYLELAFRFAHEADPEALLFYNDYSTTEPKKRDMIIAMIKGLQAKKVPIHGIGHQMHTNIIGPRISDIADSIEKFAELGIAQHVTELDMSMYTGQNDVSVDSITPEMLTRQAFRYKEMMTVFRQYKKQITSVTFWGMADNQSWLNTWPKPRKEAPLLFDAELRTKEAFWAVIGDTKRTPIKKKQQMSLETSPNMTVVDDASWAAPGSITSPLAKGNGFTFASAWETDQLFLRFDIQASTKGKAKDEAIHVFIDPNNSKSTSYDKDDMHLVLYRDGRTVPGVAYKVFPTPTGYRILATVETVTKTGKSIGFDARHTSVDGVVSAWNDSTMDQDLSTANWGSLSLLPSVRMVSAKKGTPIIDGTIDPVWDKAPEIETTVKVQGKGDTARAKIKLLWDDSSTLYLLYKVTDNKLGKANTNPWEQDSVEAFIDENNARAQSYDADDAQFRVNYENKQTFAGAAKDDRITSMAKLVDGGYLVEMAIKLKIAPKPGVAMGFDAQINDDTGTGSRQGVMIWQDKSDNTWQSMAKTGLLGFAE